MSSALRAYLAILRPDGAWRFSLAGFFARLYRVGISVGVIMLVLGASGDYALSGIAAGSAVVASAIAAPAWSLVADRLGQARVIPVAIVASLAGITLLVVVVASGAPRPAWIATAFLAGLAVLDAGAIVRARWMSRLSDAPSRQTALALESASDELAFLVGLPIVALVAGAVGAAYALIGAAVLSAAGFAVLLALRASAPPATRGEDVIAGPRAWLPPGVLPALPAFIGVGVMFGTMNVSGVAITEAAGVPQLAGIVIGVFSIGAVASGLAWGVIGGSWSPRRRLASAVLLYAVTAPALLLVREPLGYSAAVMVIGVGVGAVLVTAFGAVEAQAPREAITVAMAWPPVAISLGSTLGAVAAGIVVDAGGPLAVWWLPFAGVALGGLGLLAVSSARRQTGLAEA